MNHDRDSHRKSSYQAAAHPRRTRRHHPGLLSLMQGHSGAHSILLAKDGADFVNLAGRTGLPRVPEAAKSGRLAGNEGSSS